MKTTTKIEMRPEIDWSQEDLVLISNAGVERLPHPRDELTANYRKCYQCWDGVVYDIRNCGDYLSVVVYRTPRVMSRVHDFLDAAKSGKVHMQQQPWWRTGEDEIREDAMQLRIYRDRKCVLVRHVTLEDREIFYVSDFAKAGLTTREHQFSSRFGARTNWRGWGCFPTWGRTSAHEQSRSHINHPAFVEVHSDEEIRKYAAPMSVANDHDISSWCPRFAEDARETVWRFTNATNVPSFSEETARVVDDFFKPSDAANKNILVSFHKRTGSHRSGYRSGSYEIFNSQQLFDWLFVVPHVERSNSKSDRAQAIVSNPVVTEYWNNPDEHINEAIWFRDGDNICLIIPRCQTTSWGFGGSRRKLFAYNVRTKTRLYGECSTGESGEWTFPIPSLHYVGTACFLGTRTVYRHGVRDQLCPTTRILGGISLSELFAGSNVGWILDNASDTCGVYDVDTTGSVYDHASIAPRITVAESINESHISTVALSILISSGVPVAEQLLKAKLFDLYFAWLEDQWDHRDDKSAAVFKDLDQFKDDMPGASWKIKSTRIFYKGKQKNLRKMFDMTMAQLRLLNDFCATKPTTLTYRSGTTLVRMVPDTIGMAQAMGVDSLTAVDLDTFRRALELGGQPDKYRSAHTARVWGEVSKILAVTLEGKRAPKAVVEYLEAYNGHYQELQDYLSMRNKLRDLQKRLPDVEGIFSEKQYPLHVGSAKKFIQFLRGMPDSRYSWRREPMTEEDFYHKYTTRYKAAAARGDICQVYDDLHRLNGIVIRMTPDEHLCFLHDEASYWVSFYQNAGKNEEFREAVKRVQPLQWRDPEGELMIVAPHEIEDLKEEGSVLSHCVASYVDPIINGKENIMLLRRQDMPDVPFFTVEVLDDGEIRQVHCYRNGSLTEDAQQQAFADSGLPSYNKPFDVIGFLQKWATAMRGKIKAGTIQPYYRALCARR